MSQMLCLPHFMLIVYRFYFVDPVHRAIGLSHSGWERGTVNRMGKQTLIAMNRSLVPRHMML